MNEACKKSIIKKTISGRHSVPKNAATLCSMNTSKYTAIDPTATPVSAYTKKIK